MSEPNPSRPPFDAMAIEVFRRAIGNVLEFCPEVRSVTVSLDYYNGLGDAKGIKSGIWLTRRHPALLVPETDEPRVGPVYTADAIFGSLMTTLKILHEQVATAQTFMVDMRSQAEFTGKELVQAHEELKRVKEATDALRPTVRRDPATPTAEEVDAYCAQIERLSNPKWKPREREPGKSS